MKAMDCLSQNPAYSVFRHTGEPIGTQTYLFVDNKTRDAIVFDASYGAAEAVSAQTKTQNLLVKAVIDTHGHWDHVLDNHAFLALGIPLWIHPLDEPMIGHNQGRFMMGDLKYVPTQASARLNEGDLITLGHFSFTVLHTPGHTPGGICLYEKSLKLLFAGDTLFQGTYGRTDFPGGSVRDMQASLQRLGELPDDVKVFPGHGESTTIGAEAWIKNLDL